MKIKPQSEFNFPDRSHHQEIEQSLHQQSIQETETKQTINNTKTKSNYSI